MGEPYNLGNNRGQPQDDAHVSNDPGEPSSQIPAPGLQNGRKHRDSGSRSGGRGGGGSILGGEMALAGRQVEAVSERNGEDHLTMTRVALNEHDTFSSWRWIFTNLMRHSRREILSPIPTGASEVDLLEPFRGVRLDKD